MAVRYAFEKKELSHQKPSSNIHWVRYDSDTQRMRIRFHSGSLYEYERVELDLFLRMRVANSLGRFFHREIRRFPSKYPYRRLS